MSLRMNVVGNEVFVEGHFIATINENAIYSHKEDFINSINKMDEIISENQNLNED